MARTVAPRGRKGSARRLSGNEAAEIFRRFAAKNPEPRGELNYKNPFTLLVAVVLSAQATDAGVNKATPALFAVADTPEKMAALGEKRVQGLIKTIGLFRTKAKNLVALSKKIVQDHGGAITARSEGAGRGSRFVVTLPAAGRDSKEEPVAA